MAGLPVRVQALQSVIGSLCVIVQRWIAFQWLKWKHAFIFTLVTGTIANGNHLDVEVSDELCEQHIILGLYRGEQEHYPTLCKEGNIRFNRLHAELVISLHHHTSSFLFAHTRIF